MSSIMRRRRGLKSAISILLSEGGLQHPHPLSQEAIYATLPLTPRQRLRSIHNHDTITSMDSGPAPSRSAVADLVNYTCRTRVNPNSGGASTMCNCPSENDEWGNQCSAV